MYARVDTIAFCFDRFLSFPRTAAFPKADYFEMPSTFNKLERKIRIFFTGERQSWKWQCQRSWRQNTGTVQYLHLVARSLLAYLVLVVAGYDRHMPIKTKCRKSVFDSRSYTSKFGIMQVEIPANGNLFHS